MKINNTEHINQVYKSMIVGEVYAFKNKTI